MRSITEIGLNPVTSPGELRTIFQASFSRLRNDAADPRWSRSRLTFFPKKFRTPGVEAWSVPGRYGPDLSPMCAGPPLHWFRQKNPVIYAAAGNHYARAWAPLKRLAEVLAAPVPPACRAKARSGGPSLSLGSGASRYPRAVLHFLEKADGFLRGLQLHRNCFWLLPCLGKDGSSCPLDPNHLN